MITADDLRNPKLKSGFKHVRMDNRDGARRRYSAQFNGMTRKGSSDAKFIGIGRYTAVEAAEDACAYLNGREVVRLFESLPPRERIRLVASGTFKQGWPDAMRAAIIARDGCCVLRLAGCGGPDFPFLQVDHIDPDGPHSMENGQTVCPNCHARKTFEPTEADS